MYDIATALKTFLETNLPSGSTGEADNKLLVQLDEYNPIHPSFQLVVINRPTRTRFIAPNLVRIDQDMLLDLHLKFIRYDPATVSTLRTTYENLKTYIKAALNKYRFDSLFSVTDTCDPCFPFTYWLNTTINIGAWTNVPVPHGYGRQREPLEIVSRLTLSVIYYEVDV